MAANNSYISMCISTVTLSVSLFARCFVIPFDNSPGSFSSPCDRHNMFCRSDWLRFVFGSKQLRSQSLIQGRGVMFCISECLNKHAANVLWMKQLYFIFRKKHWFNILNSVFKKPTILRMLKIKKKIKKICCAFIFLMGLQHKGNFWFWQSLLMWNFLYINSNWFFQPLQWIC